MITICRGIKTAINYSAATTMNTSLAAATMNASLALQLCWMGTTYNSRQHLDNTIAVDLLEEFTSKLVITPDSEEGGVITPDFTTPVNGLK